METWETLTMSAKEVRRPGLLKAALAGHVSNAQGAAALQLSIRQFQRLTNRYRAGGAVKAPEGPVLFVYENVTP